MANRFFITGLPRSRTAWMTVATSRSNAICHHEPSAWLKDEIALADLWAPSVVSIGISDSALGSVIGAVLTAYQPRTLVIRRPVNDVVRSCNAYVGKGGLRMDQAKLVHRLRWLERQLAAVAHHPLVKTVDYQELNSVEVVKDCIHWLTPSVRPPADLDQLMHLNIQADLGYSVQVASAAKLWWMPAELI